MATEADLRALLAEARREHDGDANIGACGTDNDDNDTRCERCKAIDSALAEPVARPNPYGAAVAEMRGDAWQREALRLERERDEARAEVARLKAALTAGESAFGLGFDAGYRRGAEAMREAAIAWMLEGEFQLHAETIRALPVPEDKP